jgi:hypothetical protein
MSGCARPREAVEVDPALGEVRCPGERGGRLAGDHRDRSDMPFGGGAHGVETDQGAGGDDDARAALPREIDQARVR